MFRFSSTVNAIAKNDLGSPQTYGWKQMLRGVGLALANMHLRLRTGAKSNTQTTVCFFIRVAGRRTFLEVEDVWHVKRARPCSDTQH